MVDIGDYLWYIACSAFNSITSGLYKNVLGVSYGVAVFCVSNLYWSSLYSSNDCSRYRLCYSGTYS